ncbi:roadblock/LC7 domain-containing protein [Variovorax sp.]|uniref:roadblock/LC7 domain-containing protein n=1 Tax=Variovorax sp. TaxID=1871043 RepID=UPI0025E1CED8|nr:roadblock/LC7 domain-containing protein [Variovorax sp.]
MNIPPRLKDAAESAVDTLMREIKGVKAVVISTEDGLELAARVENTAQVARLSAIASSLAALGAVPILGEALTPLVVAGIALVTFGVYRATRC